jgi:soluble lytic murein transglycosylase
MNENRKYHDRDQSGCGPRRHRPQDALPGQPVPYSAVSQSVPGYSPTYQGRVLDDQDTALFRQGLAAARARDIPGAQAAISQMRDPTARKLIEWALIDTSGEQLSYAELAQAQTALKGWPRAESRRAAAESVLDRVGATPDAVMALFSDHPPETVQGAIANASALEQRGRHREARALIRDWWRTRSFDAEPQSRILARWGGELTPADHEARLNMLLLRTARRRAPCSILSRRNGRPSPMRS